MKREYDLEERTAKFGEDVILLCKELKIDTISRPIISQLVRSATSVGAIIVKQMAQAPRKIFAAKFIFAKKKLRKQNTG